MDTRWQPDSVGRAFDEKYGCWPIPRGCTPTDIDGELEINECLLHIESKHADEGLTVGQGISLRRKAECYGHSIIVQHTSASSQELITDVKLMFRSVGDVGICECIEAARFGEPRIGQFEQREFLADALLRDELVVAWSLWVDNGRRGDHPWMLGPDVGLWLDEHYPAYRQQLVLA